MESNKMMSGNQNNLEANVEHDLWAALLQAEGVRCTWKPGESLTEDQITIAEHPNAAIAYPWIPIAPEADAGMGQFEEAIVFEGWAEEEISSRSQTFFAHLDHLWASTAQTASLQATLAPQFAARIPQALLTAIASRAQQMVNSSLSAADQLVQCVQDLLPSLTQLVEEDLYVVARPLAHAMRDSETVTVRAAAWDELSETEKARLSLIVAHEALAELKKG